MKTTKTQIIEALYQPGKFDFFYQGSRISQFTMAHLHNESNTNVGIRIEGTAMVFICDVSEVELKKVF